jgi:hypothetical protein
MKDITGSTFMACILNPDLWKALIGWQFTGCSTEKLPLHTGFNTFCHQYIGPECGKE